MSTEPMTLTKPDDVLTNERLANCPFCGSEPSVSTYETESLWSHNQVTYTKVECPECEIAFNSEPGYEVEAPVAWNRRKTVKVDDAALDEIEVLIDNCYSENADIPAQLDAILGLVSPMAEMAKQITAIRELLLDGQGDDEGAQILPDLSKEMSALAMVEACAHLLERRRDTIEALSRRQSDGSSGMVKGLEWKKPDGAKASETMRKAETIIGTYRVWTHHEAGGLWFWQLSDGPLTARGEGDNAEDCISQIDLHYRTRILSAIQPVSGDGSEPIRHIILGRGEWVAGVYLQDELPSLCFGPAPEPKEPGTKPTEEVAQFATRNGAVIISFGSVAAATRMLDMVKEALEMKQASIPTTPGATS